MKTNKNITKDYRSVKLQTKVMISKNKINIRSKFLSPYLYYAISWGIVVFSYLLYWSNLIPKLSPELFLFLVTTIILSLFLFAGSGKIVFDLKINERKSIRYVRFFVLFTTGMFLCEAVLSRGFPLLFLLQHKFVYSSFGLPFIHVIYFAFSSLFCGYSYICYRITKRKKFLIYTLYFFSPGVFCFTRSYIMYNALFCFIIFLTTHKFKIKNKLILFIGIFLLGIFSLYLFGILGEIRMVNLDKNETYIEKISYPSQGFKKSNISPLFLWGYCYITTPLGNLQHTMNVSNTHVLQNVDNLDALLFHFMPDLLKKRFFNKTYTSGKLIVSYFNVSSIYSDIYACLGFFGLIYSFFGVLLIIRVLYFLKKKNSIWSYLAFVYLSILIFFNMFSNMFNFMGLAPQFWIAFILTFDWRKVFKYRSTEKCSQ